MNRLSHAVPVTLLLAIASAARAQVLYWTEGSNTPVGGGQIWRANLDGTDRRTIATGLNYPTTIVPDPTGLPFIYWTDAAFGQGGERGTSPIPFGTAFARRVEVRRVGAVRRLVVLRGAGRCGMMRACQRRRPRTSPSATCAA